HRLRARERSTILLHGAREARRTDLPRPRDLPAEDRVSAAGRTVEHITCLGCGCACDDICVVVQHDRIGEARNACALGAAWFGDGSITQDVRVHGRTASLEQALDEAARILRAAQRPLVYLAVDLSCEAQREAVALADRLGAMLDGVSSGAAAGILAAQRRGRAGATLGEIRQRADVIVFWGTDPAERYPRFTSRYAVEPRGLQTPEGRSSRTVIAVDVVRGGGNRSGAEAVLTWQTGFPFAVDFAPGYPSYRPRPGAIGLLAVGELDAALVIGSPASLPEPMATGLAPLVTVAIGPR